MASVLVCVWQPRRPTLRLVDTPCPELRQDGRPRTPRPTQAAGPTPLPGGRCLVPVPDGSLRPGGGGAVGLQVWPPLSVATAVQGTCSRCEFCGPDPCPRVRLWWVRVCCDKPPGGGQELESHVPPQWGGRGVSDQRQACLWLPAPGSGPPGCLAVTPCLGVHAATPPGRLLPRWSYPT